MNKERGGKNREKNIDVEHIKAKLESAKEELKKRYGETVEKIKKDMDETSDTIHDTWDKMKINHSK
jgi:hypothetical protein